MATQRLTRAERSAQTREELLAAAQRRFFADGYHATALGDIADDAGYTKGAVYSTFGSKAGLFLALLDEAVEQRLTSVAALLDASADADEAMRTLAAQRVDERNTRFLLLAIEFWVHASREPELLDAFAQRYRRMRIGLAELAPASSALDPERWAIVTLALSNGLALERLIDPGGVPDDLMAAVQRRIVDGSAD